MEVWLEKDALAGVLLAVTVPWDVPLMVSRGYSSITYLHAAAQTIEDQDKPTFIYFFGDHDPSGLDMVRSVEDGLRRFAPEADITFEKVAVTPGQIEEWNLPTRPTKRSDSRSRSFQGDSIDVDAIPPNQRRKRAEECITRHIDQGVLERTRAIEAAERETLKDFIDDMDGAF